MINEHDRVALTQDLPEHGLKVGDVGCVVHIYPDAAGYEVEFFNLSGETLDVVTISAGQVRGVAPNEIANARQVA